MYKRSRKSVRFREVSVKRKFTVYNFHRLFALLNGETLKLSSKTPFWRHVQGVYSILWLTYHLWCNIWKQREVCWKTSFLINFELFWYRGKELFPRASYNFLSEYVFKKNVEVKVGLIHGSSVPRYQSINASRLCFSFVFSSWNFEFFL